MHCTGFVTRKARRESLVEQDLPTLPEHPISPPVFSEVRIAKSLDFSRLLFCFVVHFLVAIVLSDYFPIYGRLNEISSSNNVNVIHKSGVA